jgi:uncharacterized protein YoxC
MNCPDCNSPIVEGKRYCADCGTPLDPEALRVEALVKSTVEAFVKEKYKDQKAVEFETLQAIAERAQGWLKLFAFFVGIPLALFAIVLTVLGIGTLRDFQAMVNKGQSEIKDGIAQAKSQIQQAQSEATGAKTSAEEALKTTDAVTAQVNKQLSSASQITRNVEELSNRVSELEKQTSSQMRGSTQRVEAEVKELHQQMESASKDMAEQQKKLASTDEIVKALFSKGVTEYFPTKADSQNTVILPYKTAAANGAFVYMLLKAAPIYQTLELKWRVAAQPRSASVIIQNNVLVFNWGEPVENLRQFPLEVTYVPDPTVKIQPFKALTVKEGKVLADGVVVGGVPPSQ